MGEAGGEGSGKGKWRGGGRREVVGAESRMEREKWHEVLLQDIRYIGRIEEMVGLGRL